MRKPILAAVACLGLLVGGVGHGLAASLVARVDVANQTMTVSKYGKVIHVWKVSTARKGYITPRGSWRPTRMHRMWYSRKYDNSPMPYSVFYHGGYAIHGTNAVTPSRPAGLAWLRAAGHGQCETFLFAGAGVRAGQYPHHRDELRRSFSAFSEIIACAAQPAAAALRDFAVAPCKFCLEPTLSGIFFFRATDRQSRGLVRFIRAEGGRECR